METNFWALPGNEPWLLGSIHSTFVHSISNSTVDHFSIDSINALIFVPVVWWRNCILFDIEYHTTSNTWHFRHQTTGTKNKCIDRIYIKVIDRRIRYRMDKSTMNRPLQFTPESQVCNASLCVGFVNIIGVVVVDFFPSRSIFKLTYTRDASKQNLIL